MHLGIIMDGNRRWAKQRGLPKFIGHKKGVDNLEKLIDICLKHEISILTVYALSTENLKREPKELKNLFQLLEKYVKPVNKFIKRGIKVRIIGNVFVLPESTQKALVKIQRETKKQKKMVFNIAINYGGRDEIVRTVNAMQKNNIPITVENLNENLDTQGAPNPDLIIRTGGDYRLSNFLIWQSAYASLYFTPVLWPDFNEKEFQKALDFLNAEKQNYGK